MHGAIFISDNLFRLKDQCALKSWGGAQWTTMCTFELKPNVLCRPVCILQVAETDSLCEVMTYIKLEQICFNTNIELTNIEHTLNTLDWGHIWSLNSHTISLLSSLCVTWGNDADMWVTCSLFRSCT